MIALSIVEIAPSEPPELSAALVPERLASAVSCDRPPWPLLLMPPAKSAAVVVIVSPSLAPTWNVKPVEPNTAVPLNFVWLVMSLISLPIWNTSAAIASLSSELLVPLSNCTFRSRTRCSMECTSVSAPSAVWTSEMPSCALRCAWARPPI